MCGGITSIIIKKYQTYMAYRVVITTKVTSPENPQAVGTKEEIIKDVHDVSFVGEYMVLCLVDMRTRLVRHFSNILCYEIIDQPIVNPHKTTKKP